MKTFALIIVAVVSLSIILSTPAMAQSDIMIGIGYSPDLNAMSLSAAVPFSAAFAAEFGLMFGWDYTDALDYPCPHYDYIVLDDHSFTTAGGVDILARLNLGDKLCVYAGAGIYLMWYQEVVMSNATGWTYIQSKTMEIEPTFSCGVFYDGFGAGYHSARGISIYFTSPF